MELYFIRHGQSEANANGYHAGWAPVALTPLGEEQALRANMFIKDINFDTVIVSDLLRARQTAELILPRYEYLYDMRIREYNVGNLAGKRVADCRREFGVTYSRSLATHDFTIYGGENSDMVSIRITDFMRDIEQLNFKPTSTQKIAVICHEGAIRHVLSYVLQGTVPQDNVCIDNCSVSKVEYENGYWKLCIWNFCGIIN